MDRDAEAVSRGHVRYEDFSLEIGEDGQGGWATRVLHSSAGGGTAPFASPWPPGELGELIERLEAAVVGRARARDYSLATPADPPLVDPREVGDALYRGLFRDRVADRFAYSRGRTDADAELGLRLRLTLPVADDGGQPLAALPWELLFDRERRLFLARSRRCPLVRCLDVTAPTTPPPLEPPLRVLVAMAKPSGSVALDLDEERRRIERAWGAQPLVEIDWLAPATVDRLRTALRDGRHQVLHFLGHGAFNDDGGALVLAGDDGGPRLVSGALLATTLRDFSTLRLVFLNACETARLPRRGGADPYTGVATSLVAAGLPAVLAMQFPISDRAAIAFAAAFYEALAAGDPIDGAAAEGRQAIHRNDPQGWEWATPVLFLRAADGHLVRGVVAESRVPAAVQERIAEVSDLVEEKSRGFVGRGFVFSAVERFLAEQSRGYVAIEGDPGIGKTALVAEMVRRDGHVHHFNRRSEGIVHPQAFLSNVCAQLIAAYGLDHSKLPPEAVRDGGFLAHLLADVAHRLPARRRCVLLVDALDESDLDALPAGANPLFLPSHLPEGVYAVLTTRPRSDLRLRTDVPVQSVPIVHDSEQNLADARALVAAHLGRPGIVTFLSAQGLDDDAFCDEMVRRSEGNFMYLSYVLPAIETGRLHDIELAELPDGLAGYYEQHWQLIETGDENDWLGWKLPVLEALAVAAEPITLELIGVAAGVDDRRLVLRAIELWRPFLHVRQHEVEGRRGVTYRIYHQSFREFLAARTDLGRAEERLLDRFLSAEDGTHGELTPTTARATTPRSSGPA